MNPIQFSLFPEHPLDPEGFYEWLQNKAKVGDRILFRGEYAPIVGFGQRQLHSGDRWPSVHPSTRNNPGRYGSHIIEIVTGSLPSNLK